MAKAGTEDGGSVSRGGDRLARVTAGRRKPSITDVARIAGVSYQTVSRVITESPSVSAATRARVLEVIAEVGYRRNKAATALVTNRSTTIGILTDDSPRYGPVATLLALESAARAAGYGSAVAGVKEPYDRTVPEAMGSLGDAGVDGIIVIAPLRSMAAAVRKVHVDVPVEMIAAGVSSSARGGLFTFSENQELGARMATQHLIDEELFCPVPQMVGGGTVHWQGDGPLRPAAGIVRPGIGAPRRRRSIASCSTTAWRSRWCCTTCRSATTGSTLGTPPASLDGVD